MAKFCIQFASCSNPGFYAVQQVTASEPSRANQAIENTRKPNLQTKSLTKPNTNKLLQRGSSGSRGPYSETMRTHGSTKAPIVKLIVWRMNPKTKDTLKVVVTFSLTFVPSYFVVSNVHESRCLNARAIQQATKTTFISMQTRK